MRKRVVSILILAAMTVCLLAGCGKGSSKGDSTTGGKVLNIYAWNEEFKGFFDKYYASKIPADVKVNWVINASDNGL